MANKQQKLLRKLGLKSVNGGASTVISKIEHGKFAFQEPAIAIKRIKQDGKNCWKITKRHPSHVVEKK